MTHGMATALAADGAGLAFRDTGPADRPALVLLHSLGADGHMWDDCTAKLAEDHRVVVPDSRGHGASDPAVTKSVDQWVDDLDRVLEAATATNVLLVGISMGGIQALAYAAAHPDRVRGLVVADSFAALAPDVAEARIRGLADQVRKHRMSVVADEYVAATFQRPYPAGAGAVRRSIARLTPDSYVSAVEVCFSAQISDRLANIEAPTLVLWGDRDSKTPRPLSEAIAAGVGSARFEVVPDAGHLSNIDNPDAFVTTVRAFSAECGAQPAPVRVEGGQ